MTTLFGQRFSDAFFQTTFLGTMFFERRFSDNVFRTTFFGQCFSDDVFWTTFFGRRFLDNIFQTAFFWIYFFGRCFSDISPVHVKTWHLEKSWDLVILALIFQKNYVERKTIGSTYQCRFWVVNSYRLSKHWAKEKNRSVEKNQKKSTKRKNCYNCGGHFQ